MSLSSTRLEFMYVAQPVEVATAGVIEELSVVELTADAETFDGQRVIAGTRGTVVTVWGGGKAYDVEFAHPQGVAAVEARGLTQVQ